MSLKDLMRKVISSCTLCFLLCLAPPSYPSNADITLVEAFPNLRFDFPVFLTSSNDGTNRIFVVEQPGVIRVFANDSNVNHAQIFLDILDRVRSGGEMGLLGLAFHPDYGNNGYLYVNYTATTGGHRHTVISRFSVSPGDANKADPNTELILLQFSQPFSNHNGGMLQFGPDGYLYIAVGDGGGAGDPSGNGQDRSTLLGSVLRIDVDNPANGLNYGIPSDNPFVGNTEGFREEIWVYGLRNPWRFSIDPITGQVWAGDVGQNSREEIDLLEGGNNYGWRIMEGKLCFSPSSNCNMTGLTLPIKDYRRDEGQSVTGGYVYRGSRQPSLVGAYIYGDFLTGRIWLLRYENSQITADSLLVPTDNFAISSFGVDENDELYIIDYSHDGAIYRFAADPATGVEERVSPRRFTLYQNYPNPFNPTTTITYELGSRSTVQLTIHNLLGQKIRNLVNADQTSGAFQISWDGTNDLGVPVASGIYWYHLQVGDSRQTRKMILMK